MVHMDQVREDVGKNFPELKIASISYAGEGTDSRAFLLNDDLIFRFPKHQEIVGQLNAEICLLPLLRSYIQVAIPDFGYIGRRREGGFPFVGYKKIHGVGLEKS